jgi:hypothetical protein
LAEGREIAVAVMFASVDAADPSISDDEKVSLSGGTLTLVDGAGSMACALVPVMISRFRMYFGTNI